MTLIKVITIFVCGVIVGYRIKPLKTTLDPSNTVQEKLNMLRAAMSFSNGFHKVIPVWRIKRKDYREWN